MDRNLKSKSLSGQNKSYKRKSKQRDLAAIIYINVIMKKPNKVWFSQKRSKKKEAIIEENQKLMKIYIN